MNEAAIAITLSPRNAAKLPRALPAAVREALVAGDHTVEALENLVPGGAGAASLRLLVGQCARLGLLTRTWRVDGRRFVSVEGVWRLASPASATIVDDASRCRMSRFVVCRMDRDAWVVESPLSRARVVVHDPRAAAVVHALAAPRTTRACADAVPGLRPHMVAALVGLFVELALADVETRVDGPGRPLDKWPLHELLLHERSRTIERERPIGATYRFRGRVTPVPALKPRMSASLIPLARPDLERAGLDDPPFARIVFGASAGPARDPAPVTMASLGEFLYRACRVRATRPADESSGRLYETTSRPYPSGGAMYELEIYLAVRACAPLPTGVYHYDPVAHALERLSDTISPFEGAAPVRLMVTARFQRRSWKYEGIAYATTLKDLGVLYETMRLVAAAVGLAWRVAGEDAASDVDRLARLAALDREVEDWIGGADLGAPTRTSRSD